MSHPCKALLYDVFVAFVMMYAITAFASDNTPTTPLHEFSKNSYVTSATYFSNDWPLNFWSGEFDTLHRDFQQIRHDGFDSIILVIPWREFQPGTSPITYNIYPFHRLHAIMDAARQHDLGVFVRLGYLWDYYDDRTADIKTRFIDLFQDPTTEAAWKDYCAKLYAVLSSHQNFRGGFLTWEDFWSFFELCDIPDPEIRKRHAASLGYQDYVRSTYSLGQYNNEFGVSFSSFEEIPLPMRSEPAMEVMYAFFDQKLISLLKKSQSVFPDLSMEVRLDADLVHTLDGKSKFYFHHKTYDCANSSFTATMYGIPMGFENAGERVSAADALMKTQYMLSSLLEHNGGKPVFVEQFLFMDNAPQFPQNAQLQSDQVELYLRGVAEPLSRLTRGYGIWTYRNYRNNMLYNSHFALGDAGWEMSGKPRFVSLEGSGSKVCRLRAGDTIAQRVPKSRNHIDSATYTLSFEVSECQSEGRLRIDLGSETQVVDIPMKGTYALNFKKSDSFDLRLTLERGDIALDNIFLYSFIQEGYLYDTENNEKKYIGAVRTLNAYLSKVGSRPKP